MFTDPHLHLPARSALTHAHVAGMQAGATSGPPQWTHPLHHRSPLPSRRKSPASRRASVAYGSEAPEDPPSRYPRAANNDENSVRMLSAPGMQEHVVLEPSKGTKIVHRPSHRGKSRLEQAEGWMEFSGRPTNQRCSASGLVCARKGEACPAMRCHAWM